MYKILGHKNCKDVFETNGKRFEILFDENGIAYTDDPDAAAHYQNRMNCGYHVLVVGSVVD